MKILVTGAGGYVGTYIGKHLSAIHDVISVCSENHIGNDLVQCDLSARSSINYLKKFDFDVIVHMAAQVPLLHGKQDSLELNIINKNIDENILALAYEKNVLIIYFSTCGLYDEQDPNLKNEEYNLKKNGYYLESKFLGEKLILGYEKGCVLRISSPYEFLYFPENILSKFYQQATKDRVIKIWGKGQREQDFVNLEDCLFWINSIAEEKITGVYNATSGHAVTTYQLAKHIIGSSDISLVFETLRDEQNQFTRYDNNKIIQVTNHYPKHIFDSIQCLQ